MKKYFESNRIILIFALLLFLANKTSAQTYPITIRVAILPPVSPYFDQTLQGTGGMHLMVSLFGAPSATGGSGQYQIKIAGTLQRLSPSPFTLSLNTNFQPQQPIFVPFGSSVMLNSYQLEQGFGNLVDNNLSLQDISFSSIKDGINFKLPEGTYRLCITAYEFVDNGYARPLSDPNASCATFTVCYKASAPQFVQPVNAINLINGIANVNPAYPLVFSWTSPNTTCGSAIPPITYDLEIHRIFNGQTPTDAINNPPVFIKQGLPSALFLLDTMLFKNVLQPGFQYAIRVHANTGTGAANNAITFDNNGYSSVQAFQYGSVSNIPVTINKNANQTDTTKNNTVINNIAKVDSTNTDTTKTDSTKNTTNQISQKIPSSITDSSADCGLSLPADSVSVASGTNLSGAKLTIAGFTLTPTTIKQNTDGSFSGTGTIDWKPILHTIKLSVAFSNIKVNKSNVVYRGLVTSSTDSKISLPKSLSSFGDFANQSSSGLDQLSGSVENFLKNYPGTQLISQIVTNSPVSFPIGIDNQNMGGTPVTVAIMSMAFSPKGATMAVMFDVNVPDANGWLSLAGTNFCLQPTGMSFAQGTLFLPVDHHFNFGSGSDSVDIAFKGCPSADSTKGTYVSWAGDSLSAIVAHASISFPMNSIVREDSTGKAMDSAVVATLAFNFYKWDDWIASISFQNFQLPGVKGLGFQPSTIYYDHSSKRNPTGFKFPKSYTGYTGNDFEGLYIQDMAVLLPSDFKTFNQGKDRTSFDTKDFVLDNKGVSVNILGTNIINLTSGNLGSWAFSLDTVKVVIQQNTFTEGAFNGKIELPVSKDSLVYSGDLHSGGDSLQYEFIIQPPDSLVFDIWAAKVELNKNSAFEVKHDSTGTLVSCVLSGSIEIDLGGNSPGINLPGLKFDSLGIANRDPKTNKFKFWFSPGNWSFASPQKSVAGFPVSINNIKPYTDFTDMSNLKLGVQFDLNVNVGFGNASVISATTNLQIYGTINASMQNMAPQISLGGGFNIDSVKIKGDVGPVSVDGLLVFYNHDQTYGDGLKGHVTATFPMSIIIDATAQFGTVNNYNYWYIDACANFPTIPVVGAIGINGFGGGAYYNMSMSNYLPADPANLQAASKANDATPGKSMSGITFIPQEGAAGIRATVCVAIVSGGSDDGANAMNAKVTLTAQIENGSLQLLNLSGNVYVITNYPSNTNATITGAVSITYDFSQNKFSLVADVQGQFATVTADIPIGMYAGPDGWYFKIGDAFAKRVSFTLINDSSDVFVMHLGATAYFEMGSLINPQLPDLPSQITSHGLTRDPSATALIDEMNQAPGEGMMFGAEVDGNLSFNFAMLYAKAQAIVGFDMALKHFDNVFECNNQAAGWENWYAMGQIYAYLGVDVGIHVDVWFYQGDLSLVSLQVSALLTGGLPNPTWLDGNLQVDGEVLNGLISIHTSAHFTIGDKCYPTSDPLRDLQIISDYGPKQKGDVFDYPYVASNVGLNTNYDIDMPPTNQYPNGEIRTFQFNIESYSITENGGQTIQCSADYENNNTTVYFKHQNMLKPHTTYTVNVLLNVMQFYPDQNKWGIPYNDSAQSPLAQEQTTTFNFTTGDAPDCIPAKNVHFSYPVNLQRYVLKQEFGGKGILTLNEWQNNILNSNTNKYANEGGSRFNTLLYFIDINNNDTIKSTFSCDAGNNNLTYTLPVNLKNNTVYRVDFYSLPGQSLNVQMLSHTQVTQSARSDNNVNYSVKQTSVTSALKMQKESQPIYSFYFRTSNYNNFADKINSLGTWSASRDHSSDNIYIQDGMIAPESFDQFEVQGFTAPDGTSYPSLFQAKVEWDPNQPEDRFADDNLYANSITLAVTKLVRTDFATPEVRELYRPVKTLDWSGFNADAPLGAAEIPIMKYAQESNHSNVSMNNMNTGQNNNSGRQVITRSGFSVIVPPSSNLKTAGMAIVNVKMEMPYQIKWTRDFYIHQDYDLLNEFGLTAQTQAAIVQHQLDPGDQESTLDQMDDDITFSTNNLGGTVTMPWNKFYYLYTDPKSLSILNNLRYLKYPGYQPGNSLPINFSYVVGPLKSNVDSKIFTLK